MKRYDDSFDFDVTKRQAQAWRHAHKSGGFKCSHCKQFVVINNVMGTANRNHCNLCLWSKHLDKEKGDRKSQCNGGMEPLGLTFKHDGHYRIGEVMLIHVCVLCYKISINRIARDDFEHKIIGVFNTSTSLDTRIVTRIKSQGIYLLSASDAAELHTQLYGT